MARRARTFKGSVDKDVGQQNYINQHFHKSRMHPNSRKQVSSFIKEMFTEKYSYDILKEGIPYLATVLEVRAGPNAKPKPASGKRGNSESKNPPSKTRTSHGEKVRIIAKIPEFDTGLGWPRGEKDYLRICAHGEYIAQTDEGDVNQIEIEDLVWVHLRGPDSSPSDGLHAGFIIGLFEKASLEDLIAEIPKPKLAFSKPCKSNRSSESPDVYIRGETHPKPNIAYSMIEKYKTRIKTGLYGNGTPQTKHHFNAALTSVSAKISFKNEIPGAAPGKNNAFIWVGHLRNNGYLDLLDRPIGLGRETIIYAPMTLDLLAPIELKYYFHDRAGFGHAWINGPDTKTEESIKEIPPGNDFREKIAPAIKDLIKEKRNFILVIPEMAYSRGFGTKSNNTSRTEKMSKGERVNFSSAFADKAGAGVIRTKITRPEVFSAVKNYLRGLPVGIMADEETVLANVLQKTYLSERETATFDGSFTGGLFGSFHVEVLEIIKNHLGKDAFDNISYISLLADGMGATNLASIVKFMTYSSVHNTAELSFKSVPINRIDYVENSKDVTEIYNFSRAPLDSFYEDYLSDKATSAEYFEFNYITEVSSIGTGQGHEFFNKMGHLDRFKKAINSAATKGDKKFSLNVGTSELIENVVSNIRAVINLHVVPDDKPSIPTTAKKVAYAFPMQSELQGATALPLVSNSSVHQVPVGDYVPDHAGAATSRPSEGLINDHFKNQRTLKSSINKFAGDVLESLITEMFCFDDKTKNYCADASGGTVFGPGGNTGRYVSYSPGGGLSTRFIKYLENLKNYYRYGVMIEHGVEIAKIANNKKELENRLNDVNTELEIAIQNNTSEDHFASIMGGSGIFESHMDDEPSDKKFTVKSAADKLQKGPNFKVVMPSTPEKNSFFMHIGDLATVDGAYRKIIYSVARESALTKIKEDLEGLIGNALETTETMSKDPNCDPHPITLREIKSRIIMPPARSSRYSEHACADNTIRVASTFKELKAMLSWNPVIEDWKNAVTANNAFPNRKYTTKHVPTSKGKLIEAPTYRTKTFKYRTRGQSSPIYRDSPEIWSCISEKIRESWEAACNISSYIPFRITSGIKGRPNHPGVTAYNNGMSIDAFGLAINVDSPLAGYSGDGLPVYSVFTGMWTPGFVETSAQELYDLGVLYDSPNTMSESPFAIFTSGGPGARYLDNAYTSGFYYVQNMSKIELTKDHGKLPAIELTPPETDEGVLGGAHIVVIDNQEAGFVMPEPELVPPSPRLADEWSGAADAYSGPAGLGEKKTDYDKIMESAENQIIVPPGTNPVQWLLTFCERSGMKWGNSFFLRKRFRGGAQSWSLSEQRRIAAIYGISDIVARINAISWPVASVDKHMHFQYYAGGPIITWEEIEEN